MQKQILAELGAPVRGADAHWMDLEATARVQLTSEQAAHPIEAALRGQGESGWQAAQPGAQTIWFSFYAPQVIDAIYVCFEVHDRRTQEFVIRWSNDGGVSYHDLVRQQYNFSSSTSREEETYYPRLLGVTDVKLEIVPDISGGNARASLRAFRLG